MEEALRDVRLFRANVADALENAVEVLTVGIAADVVARELQIAPAEIDAIVRRTLEEYWGSEPLRVRLHPEDAKDALCDLPIVEDASLLRGDAVIELREGVLEATLGARLDSVLNRLQG